MESAEGSRPLSKVQWGALLLLVVLPLLLWGWMDTYRPHPYWLVRGDAEQDMAYTAWAWVRYGLMSYRHPGTPIFLLHGALFRLLGGGMDDIPAFLFWSHGLVALLRSLTVVLWGLWARHKGIPFPWVVVTLVLWLAHPTALAFAELLNTDSYLPVLGLWFLTAGWELLEHPTWKGVAAVGVFAGLLLSVKFSTTPLVVAVALALGWRLLNRPRQWGKPLLLVALALGTFLLLAPYPHSPRWGVGLLKYFLGRGDVHIQGAAALAGWKKVLAFQDVYWLAALPVVYGMLTLGLMLALYRLGRNDLYGPTTAQGVLWALLFAAWVYTIGAQQKDLPPYMQFILNVGYRLRNTYPPSLGFVMLPGWLALTGVPRRRTWVLGAQMAVLIVGMLSWGAFLQEREQVYRLLEAMHTAVQTAWRQASEGGEEPMAFWSTKGLPIVDEAAFHWEGNLHPGRMRFSAEITRRFPGFVLFDLRRVPQALRLLPPKPSGRFSRQDCQALEAKRAAWEGPPLLPSVSYGVYPRWVLYWDWEQRKALKVSTDEVRWALCLYGWPAKVGEFHLGAMRWVLLRLER